MSATYLDQSNTSLSNEEQGFMESAMDIDTLMEDIDEVIEEIPKIRLGICAMNKKTNSQPMQEILTRISRFDFVEVVIFPDNVIKNEPVEKWPICDTLISFYSSGFPLSKAITYSALRKPFVLNDLEMQFTLKDRCAVYNLLESAKIEMPRYAILMRDNNGTPIDCDFIELEDSIQIGNIVFQKPFVEKPIDAEDHNVFIYFPSSAGGGSQRLFRKVGSRSSIYSAESSVRKYGSYIYEDFVHTDGTDVKIYTVGPEYAHAEARKSPSLDGKVERDGQGKEIRYPVILNPYEKDIAHQVCKLFKQTVCGFDLLRTHGKSFVCDVNGFSFVKTSKKYYDDCAQVLVNIILQQLAPQLYKPYEIDTDSEDRPMAETLEGTMLELRCVVGIIRHGDRTPKQKLKMEVRHPKFIELFNNYSMSTKKKLKLKQPNQLQEVLDIARSLLEEMENGNTMYEKSHKLNQLKNVLEMYGHFSGINRKIQLKYLGHVHDKADTNSGGDNGEESQTEKTPKIKDKGEEALLLIMKWGGELTQAGRVQAEDLGRAFRCIYPGGDGAYSAIPGCGLLRLHSTYRHDLKIYASDEGRVQMTAGAFAKGFLALEGELTPILVHLVRSDNNTTEMLDTSDQATKFMAKVKHKLHDLMQVDRDFIEEDYKKLAPTHAASLINAMKRVKNPRQMCAKVSCLVHSLTKQLKDIMNSNTYNPRDPFLYHDETLELMTHRWNKLDKDFKLKNGMYDISLIPDIYDSIKYDVQHNSILGLENTQELYNCIKSLADIVIPQEYGITADQKVKMSQTICQRLLRKIQGDLTHADVTDTFTRLNPKYSQSVISPHRHVRTRLYFTSESHVHSVINALRYGDLFENENMNDFQWKRALDFLAEVPELNYMTQIILMLYEDPTADVSSENRFHIEVHFSPGAKTLDKKNSQQRGHPAEPKKSRPVTDSHIKEERIHSKNIPHVKQDIKASGKDKEAGGSNKEELLQQSSSRDISNDDYDEGSFHDDTQDVDNEHSRSTIGRGDFNDSTGSPVSTDVFHEDPQESTPRRRKSGLELVGAFHRTQSESDVDHPVPDTAVDTTRQTFSDSDIYTEIPETPPDDQAENTLHSDTEEKDDNDDNEDDQSETPSERPLLQRARSQSTSCLDEGSFTGREERSASDPRDEPEPVKCSQSTNALDLQMTSVSTMPTMVMSDSVVLDTRQHATGSGQRPSSCPALKKPTRKSRFSTAWRNSSPDGVAQDGHGTLFYMPAIRAVTKKLSMQVHGAFRIRPPIPISDCRRPPISEFYDQTISSVDSIDPLLTLHNGTPLRTMDKFLSRMIEEKNGESDVSTTSTPATTPTRKTKHKKLSLKASTQQQLLEHNDSVVGLDLLDMNEFKS